MPKISKIGFTAFVLVLMQACGYSFMRADKAFALSAIQVPPFQENVAAGIAGDLTQAVSRKIAAGGLRISNQGGPEVGLLKGTVTSMRTSISPTVIGSSVASYRTSLKVAFTLYDHNGVPVWKTPIQVAQDFMPPEAEIRVPATIEANRRRAMTQLVNEAAEAFYEAWVMGSISYLDSLAAAPEQP